MNADRLLELYEQISEAPDAIAQMRRFVLDLAVRGKLVEQDLADEPASKLLDQIFQERKRLHELGEIKKPKKLPPIDTAPFQLPSSWTWVRIRDVTSDRGQEKPSTQFTYIDVSAINKEAGIVSDPKVLTPEESPSRARKIVRNGDVIYSCVRPYLLNVAVVTEKFDPAPIASTAFAILNGYGLVLPWYLWIALRSPFMVKCVEQDQRGQAYPAINDRDFAVLPLPLPPLAEQHRIVTKVDELMGLCDRLEEARKTREETRNKFTAATLARLTAPEAAAASETDGTRAPSALAPNQTGPESAATGSPSGTASGQTSDFRTHARFAIETLPALTSRPDQIKSLRQTILNLAVRGKLVEQDPADEPAAKLLEAIAFEQTELVKSGKIKKPKALPSVDIALAPFDLPNGWEWARFPELGTFGRGKSKHRPRNDPTLYRGGTVPFIQTGDVARSGGSITSHKGFYNEVGLAQSMLWPRGTMCITIAANIADSGILEFDACFPDSVVGLVPASMFENARYFEYFIRTAKANLLEFAPATAQKNINLGILETVLIPLPPLAEQHRIVAKVNALMALCDRLEAALTSAHTTRTRLLETLLHEALEPAAEELKAAE